jgi:hypothetical protein
MLSLVRIARFQICCQNCSSMSGRGVKRLQSFGDFQGSGWKLASFLRGVSQGGSLSVFSLPYLMLSLPWLMKLCRGESGQTGGSRQGYRKSSTVEISAPRRAREILTAHSNTRLFEQMTPSGGDTSLNAHSIQTSVA